MLTRAIRTVLAVPRAPDPPVRVWRDWVLVAGFAVAAVLEGIFRTDLAWRPVVVLVALAIVPTLLWRRTHPLGAVLVAFGVVLALDLAGLVAGVDEPLGLGSTIFVLVLPYALMRWGSGRDVVLGSLLIVVVAVVGISQDPTTTLADAVGGFIVLTLAEVSGLAVRQASTAQERSRHEVRLRERELLARELHDTVAHHMTAVVVRAQAGQVVARAEPEAAVEALAVIEAEAGRTLAELRALVGSLRDRDDADLAPQPGVADLERLVSGAAAGPAVVLELSGRLDDLRPALGTAVYRIAQEAVTNALRHARHATRVVVRVVGEDDCVRLTVSDDGDPGPPVTSAEGYGLVGMAERAALLRGTFAAGPEPGRGWVVRAVLPRAVR